MLNEDKSKKRVERHAITQEDFTPKCVVEKLVSKLPEDTFTDFKKTIIDTSSGIGNLLVGVLIKRLENTSTERDAINAMRTIYGVELMADNVQECRERLYNLITEKYPSIKEDKSLNYELRAIIRNRIQWGDSLTFDYEHWPKIEHLKPSSKRENVSFEERRRQGFTKYPMWYIEKQVPKQLSLFPEL